MICRAPFTTTPPSSPPLAMRSRAASSPAMSHPRFRSGRDWLSTTRHPDPAWLPSSKAPTWSACPPGQHIPERAKVRQQEPAEQEVGSAHRERHARYIVQMELKPSPVPGPYPSSTASGGPLIVPKSATLCVVAHALVRGAP